MKIYAINYEHEGTNEGDVVNFVTNKLCADEASLRGFLQSEQHVKSYELLHEWDETQPPRNKFESYFYSPA